MGSGPGVLQRTAAWYPPGRCVPWDFAAILPGTWHARCSSSPGEQAKSQHAKGGGARMYWGGGIIGLILLILLILLLTGNL
jgi:hypothetical protein